MSASRAAIGYGATLAVETSPGSGVFYSLGEVDSITPPNAQVDQVEVTHMQSPDRVKEFKAGLADLSQLDTTLNYIPSSGTDDFILAWRATGLRRAVRITYAGAGDPAPVDTFPGFILGYAPSLPVADKLQATLSVKVAGAVVRSSELTPTPAQVAKAAKILAAANAYVARTVMSSPPTIARSAGGASSTISGGGAAASPNIAPNNAAIRTTGPLINQFGAWYGGWTNDDILLDGGDGWGFGFKTNSQFIEVSLGYGQPDYTTAIRVDGQWLSVSDTALFGASPDYQPHFLKLSFASATTRTIEFFFRHSQDVLGFNLSSGATLALPDTTAPYVRAQMWGDSYVENNGGLYKLREGVAQTFGEIMGVTDIIPSGRSNQGYVLPRDSRTIASRMVTDVGYITADLDVIYVNGSVNDYNQSAATLQANVVTGLTALMTAYPNAWIVAFSSFKTQNNAIDAARNAAFRDAALSVQDARVIVIDTQALSWPTTAQTTGTLPNAAAHDSSDGVHPGPNEVAYLTGALMKPAVIAAIAARAGL